MTTLDLLILTIVAIFAVLFFVPIINGIIVTKRYKGTGKKIDRIIQKYGFTRDESLRDGLKQWANFDKNPDNMYGHYIIHEPHIAKIYEQNYFIYKKVRYFTTQVSEDLKEIAFPLKRRSPEPLMLFFKPVNPLQLGREILESRTPSTFVDKDMQSIDIPRELKEQGLSHAYSRGSELFSILISPDQLQTILQMRQYGAFSFVAYKHMAAANFDPFNKYFDSDRMMSLIFSLTDTPSM